jgi:hypothetical protein
VLILLAAGLLAAVVVPEDQGAGGKGGAGGLDGALATLHGIVAGALDLATGDAVAAAARAGGCDLGSCLDAAVLSRLTQAFPARAAAWTAELEDATGGLVMAGTAECPGTGSSSSPSRAEVRARLDLSTESGERFRVVIVASGPAADARTAASRAGAVVRAATDPAGPLAYSVKALLWQSLQGRVLAGEEDASALLDPAEVREALDLSLGRLLGGGPIPAPSPPAIELRGLIDQAIAGGVEASLGYLDGYILGDEGIGGLLGPAASGDGAGPSWPAIDLEALEVLVTDLAASALQGLVEGALDRALGGLPALPPREDLSSTIASGVELIDALTAVLEATLRDSAAASDAGLRVARGALEGLLAAMRGREGPNPLLNASIVALEAALDHGAWPLGALASRAAGALSACAAAACGFGLRSAREALLAVGATGMEVPGAEAGEDGDNATGDPAPAPVGCRIASLSADIEWSGETACAPGRLVVGMLDDAWHGRPLSAPAFGAMPFVSRCRLALRGELELTASMAGVGGPASVACSWRAPLDLPVEVTVVTGWAIAGVRYEPSRTLAGDVAEVARSAYGRLAGGAGWLASRARDAAEWVVAGLRGIGQDLVEGVLNSSAYDLSRSLLRIGESLLDHRVDRALNETWGLMSRLLGDEVRERLTWRFEAWGMDVTVWLDPLREQLGVGLERGAFNASLVVRRLYDPDNPWRARPIEGYHWGVFGRTALDMGAEGAEVSIDPLTLEQASVVTARAWWGSDGRGGPSKELSVEAVSARRPPVETGVRLSQLLGCAPLMSLGGALGTVDAGVVLRADAGAEGDLSRLALSAFRRAWLASVRGLRVGDLVDAARSPPDAGLFLEALLRELYFALLQEARASAVELEAFLEVDPPTPGWPMVHVGLVLSDPLTVLLPLMAWARSRVARLAATAAAGADAGVGADMGAGALDGAGEGLAASVAEHVLLRLELSWGVALPPWLDPGGRARRAGLAVRAEANLASLQAAAGGGADGRGWEASLSLELRDVPGAVLAIVPGLGSPSWRWADVTLVRASLRDARPPRLLLSQVLYDARGRDSDLEFVELLNADDRVVDAGGTRLLDDAGEFVVPPHRPMLPGSHLLLCRNRTAVRAEWGVAPDVWGMGLRLNNEGDVVALLSADGRVLDEVAWERAVPGWGPLEAREGEALARLDGDDRAGEPSAWHVAQPLPRRGGGF